MSAWEVIVPFVNVRLVKQAIATDPEAKKAEVAEAIATALSKVTGRPKDEVWIVFEEVEARDWYLGETSVRRLRFDTG